MIYSSFRTHSRNINSIYTKYVLAVLVETNLQVNISNCSFFKESIEYLGHMISARGIDPLKENIEAIMSIPTPITPKQVYSFVQTANFYKDFIENFSSIAAALFV